jgi:hypothetical protein
LAHATNSSGFDAPRRNVKFETQCSSAYPAGGTGFLGDDVAPTAAGSDMVLDRLSSVPQRGRGALLSRFRPGTPAGGGCAPRSRKVRRELPQLGAAILEAHSCQPVKHHV